MYFLANFLLHMRRNGHNSTSGQIFNLNIKIPWAVSYSNTNFGGASAKICAWSEKQLL